MQSRYITPLFVAVIAAVNVVGSALTVNVEVVGDQLSLSWGPGVPTFQIQTKANLTESWTNVGAPGTNESALLALDAAQRFFRVVQDFTAHYEVVFESTWSAATHPYDFPVGAHWSALVGGVHNAHVRFWREGETASIGIQLMAERGRQSNLLTEIQAAIAAGTADFGLAGSGIGTSPGSTRFAFPQPMRRDFPLVTLCSMIAPSPDWFVAVDSLPLIENDLWVDRKIAVLLGYDAGTDSGATFASPDSVTAPRGIITRFDGFPARVNGEIVPFGTFVFTRVRP